MPGFTRLGGRISRRPWCVRTVGMDTHETGCLRDVNGGVPVQYPCVPRPLHAKDGRSSKLVTPQASLFVSRTRARVGECTQEILLCAESRQRTGKHPGGSPAIRGLVRSRPGRAVGLARYAIRARPSAAVRRIRRARTPSPTTRRGRARNEQVRAHGRGSTRRGCPARHSHSLSRVCAQASVAESRWGASGRGRGGPRAWRAERGLCVGTWGLVLSDGGVA